MSRLHSPAASTATESSSELRAAAKNKRPKNRSARKVSAFVAIGLASLSGPVLLLLNSPHGIHVSFDAFTYLGAASNLAHGHGWTYPFNTPGAPVTLFPPLFPTVLALGDRLGADPLAWALHESVFLFWSLLAIVGVGVYWATEQSLPAALAGVSLGALGLPQLFVYSNVWSETLFFPLELLGLFLLAGFFATRRTRYLVLAAIATALALLTRYMGLSLFLWCCLLLALWPGRSVIQRLRVLAIFASISLAPIGVWLTRNKIESGTLTGNNQLVGQPGAAQVVRGLKVVWAWFFLPVRRDPYGLRMVVLLALAVLIVCLVAIVAGRGRWGVVNVPAAAVVLLSFPIGHLLFIVAVNAFSDRAPPFNNRMLGPAYLPLALGVLILGWALWTAEADRWSFAQPVIRGSAGFRPDRSGAHPWRHSEGSRLLLGDARGIRPVGRGAQRSWVLDRPADRILGCGRVREPRQCGLVRVGEAGHLAPTRLQRASGRPLSDVSERAGCARPRTRRPA